MQFFLMGLHFQRYRLICGRDLPSQEFGHLQKICHFLNQFLCYPDQVYLSKVVTRCAVPMPGEFCHFENLYRELLHFETTMPDAQCPGQILQWRSIIDKNVSGDVLKYSVSGYQKNPVILSNLSSNKKKYKAYLPAITMSSKICFGIQKADVR